MIEDVLVSTSPGGVDGWAADPWCVLVAAAVATLACLTALRRR